jgi:hypothetical protein
MAIMTLMAGSALALTGVATTAASAGTVQPHGTCGQVFDVFISGAEAHWTLDCFGGKITMSGRVDDTRADGKCAELKVVMPDATHFVRNCPATSPPTTFSYTATGNTAYGYLYLN